MTCDRCKKHVPYGEPVYTSIPPFDAPPRLYEHKLCSSCAEQIDRLQKAAVQR